MARDALEQWALVMDVRKKLAPSTCGFLDPCGGEAFPALVTILARSGASHPDLEFATM